MRMRIEILYMAKGFKNLTVNNMFDHIDDFIFDTDEEALEGITDYMQTNTIPECDKAIFSLVVYKSDGAGFHDKLPIIGDTSSTSLGDDDLQSFSQSVHQTAYAIRETYKFSDPAMQEKYYLYAREQFEKHNIPRTSFEEYMKILNTNMQKALEYEEFVNSHIEEIIHDDILALDYIKVQEEELKDGTCINVYRIIRSYDDQYSEKEIHAHAYLVETSDENSKCFTHFMGEDFNTNGINYHIEKIKENLDTEKTQSFCSPPSM